MASTSAKPETVEKWIRNHPELIFDATSCTLYCTKCESHLSAKKSNINRHIEGAQHRGIYKRPQEEFYFDLIKFLICCNIPWSQMKNDSFKDFFQKYICGVCCCNCNVKKVPDESQLRKVYLDKFYKSKIASIYENVKDEKLWISIDETTDFLGRYIVHFLIKPLNKNFSDRPYLMACKMLEVVNGQTISNFVIECLKNIWQDNFESKVDNVLVLCTDSVAYMLSAGRNLKNVLPQLKHVTCLAHALHRISEQIRLEYHDVDLLISNVKKIFLKAPRRVKLLKEMYPSLPLPPQPVITRWGTWLEAASYYAKYYEQIINVISRLNSSESIAIQNAKNILERDNLRNQLLYIENHYTIILFSLKELQKQNLTLSDSFLAFDQVRAALNDCNSDRIKVKIEKVLDRNPDIDILREHEEKLSNNVLNDEILSFKFAPLTSTDVERSFSTYKWVLDVKRNRLKIENLEKIMVIYFNLGRNQASSDAVDEPHLETDQ